MTNNTETTAPAYTVTINNLTATVDIRQEHGSKRAAVVVHDENGEYVTSTTQWYSRYCDSCALHDILCIGLVGRRRIGFKDISAIDSACECNALTEH